MLIIRFVDLLIGIMALYTTHLNFKRQIFNSLEFLVWSVVWLGLLLVAVAPHTIYFFLETFASGYVSDLLMIIAFVVIYVIGFWSYINYRKQHHALEQVVREMAMLSRNLDRDQHQMSASQNK